ncbi:hypothetical protein [Klebsiella quasivariicola]|uniref:hypothetical protein n=1 Tax=Klebsiella quasivariicola TaxID=2026240 RepID=UPI002479B905|nr:hypothetical protein [Klebsiella quasivariicola]
MWEEIAGWASSAFSSLFTDGSGNVSKGVMGALKLGMMGSAGGVAHSQSNAQAFHYQSNANPITALKTGFDYMKNDINVGSGLNDVKNLF